MNQQRRGKPNEKKQWEPDPGPPQLTESDYRAIIIEGEAKLLNEKTNALGAYLSKDHFTQGQRKKIDRLSSSQIRNILDEIQRMQEFDANRLQLLRPKMAYAAGRHKGKVTALQEVTDKAIQLVTNEKAFKNFSHFFEAIVAYHRYYGGE